MTDQRSKTGIGVVVRPADEVGRGTAPTPWVAPGVTGRAMTPSRAAGLVGTSAFNLGDPEDYRVPDGGYHRGRPTGTWVSTAAIVVEIVSTDDETYEKFGFYARHEVEELLIADPASREISFWRRRSAEGYEAAIASSLLGVTGADLVAAVEWPDSPD